MGLLSPAAKTELQKGRAYLGVLIELDFKTGTERYWNGLHPLQWDNVTWSPVGSAGSVSPIESSEDFRANGLEVSIAGLPNDTIQKGQVLSSSSYKGQPARFIIAFLDSSFQQVIHTHERYYYIDTVNYGIDATDGTQVSVGLETEIIKASRASVRRYTDQDQKIDYPDDQGFEFVPYLNSGVEAKWGTGGAFFK